VSVLLLILSSAFTLLSPWPLTILVDNVLGNEPLIPVLRTLVGNQPMDKTTLLLFVVLAGLLITFVNGALDVLSNFVNTRLEQRIVLDFRSDLFRHAQDLSVAYADRVSTARLMYGINFEASAAGAVIMAIEPLAQGLLTIIGMVWISFHIDPLLAVLSMTVVPFLYYAVGYYARHIQSRLLEVKGMEAESISIAHDALSMLRVIVAFVRERHEVRRFRTQGERTVDARVRLTVRQTLFSLAVSMITATGTALVLGVGAYHAMQGQLTAGQLLVVLAYVAAVYKPLESISHTIGTLQDSFTGLQMAYHVMDTRPEVKDDPRARSLENLKGQVTFEDVSFSYPGRTDTLCNISFSAEAGDAIALIGPTGAGKTTLISMLPRFYDPTSGRILLDGTDIREATLESLREAISLVPQEPILFSGTIADNIRYGRLEATQDEIVAAAQAANSHDFILQLPNQYDTQVGERGVQLSGGERQRICVARAFLKNSPILILDEPTSSIDSRTEAVILDALDRLMLGRTTFIIAHRLSTVRNADLLLVLDQGRLVEQGTADELLQANGLYRQLHEVQTAPRARKLLGARQGDDATTVAVESTQSTATTGAEPQPGRAPAYAVEWLDIAVPSRMVAGAECSGVLRIQNSSELTWLADGADPELEGTSTPESTGWTQHPIRASYHWLEASSDEVVVWDGVRTPLPDDVPPGGELLLEELNIVPPPEPGNYRLQVTLVHESVAWFEQEGASTLTVPVVVMAPAAPGTIRDPEGLLALSGTHSEGRS
jgi:ABC-type multidrug transport system fused ATPase/permease subunit